MKFLVIEGVDGSGKSTQIKLMKDYLSHNGIAYRYLHFPRTDKGIYGELIAKFLRGDLGDLNHVDPYLVALIYAGDRKDAADEIRQWLHEGFLVLLDRYVYSNIAFQCAKIKDRPQQEALRKWIFDLEYNYHGIPKPDVNILLNVPFEFTMKKLTEERQGIERDYLGGNRDIHEDDLSFQKRVREMYLWQAQTYNDLKIIECADGKGEIHPPSVIFDQIINQLNIK